jgi:NAD(P)-dependent dehydrogenase (short-subunit alcohol dehydrogenase family)
MSLFTNQRILITGAGSGIGRQLSLLLASEGAVIQAVDLHAEPLEKLVVELKGKPCAWALADVTDRPALGAATARLRDQLGPPDMLIASAGIGRETSAVMFSAADFEDLVRVNLIGVANSVEAVLADMRERRRGHLVALSSLASFRGLPRMAGYCAGKAGVNALMDALRIELQPYGIAVTTICPGWVRTPMTADLKVPMPDILEVDHAARLIIDAIRRRRPFYAFPRSSALRVRLLRQLPAGLSDWLLERTLRSLARGR